MRHRRRPVVAVIIGALVALVPSSGRAVPTTGARAPIVVMAVGEWEAAAVGTSNPEWPGAIRARARAINRSGGINDRRVQVMVCNTRLDPNRAGQCARDAVENEVAAVIGTNLADPAEEAQFFPVLEEAGIPSIATVAVGPMALSSEVSFPITPGVPGITSGLPQALTLEGAKRISVTISDLGVATTLAGLLVEQGIMRGEAEQVGELHRVPTDTADLASFAAAATRDDPDGAVTFLVGDQQALMLEQLAQIGYGGLRAIPTSFTGDETLRELGDVGEGIQAVGTVRPVSYRRSPGIRMYLRDMKAFDKDLPHNDGSIQNWLGMYVFEKVAEGLDEVNAATMLEAIGALEAFDTLGITPPLTTTSALEDVLPGVTRLFNPAVVLLEVKDGRYRLADRRFFDPFTGEFFEQ